MIAKELSQDKKEIMRYACQIGMGAVVFRFLRENYTCLLSDQSQLQNIRSHCIYDQEGNREASGEAG